MYPTTYSPVRNLKRPDCGCECVSVSVWVCECVSVCVCVCVYVCVCVSRLLSGGVSVRSMLLHSAKCWQWQGSPVRVWLSVFSGYTSEHTHQSCVKCHSLHSWAATVSVWLFPVSYFSCVLHSHLGINNIFTDIIERHTFLCRCLFEMSERCLLFITRGLERCRSRAVHQTCVVLCLQVTTGALQVQNKQDINHETTELVLQKYIKTETSWWNVIK